MRQPIVSDLSQNMVTALTDHKDYLVIQPSPIQGKGVFTIEGIEEGAVLYKLQGDRAYHAYDQYMADQNPNWIGIAYGEWLILRHDDPALFINHSCSPNVIIDRHLQVVTLKQVCGGEELLLDYATTEIDPFWKMNCNCGQVQCRNTVRSYQFLPPHLQRMYASFVPTDFTAVVKHDRSTNTDIHMRISPLPTFQQAVNR